MEKIIQQLEKQVKELREAWELDKNPDNLPALELDTDKLHEQLEQIDNQSIVVTCSIAMNILRERKIYVSNNKTTLGNVTRKRCKNTKKDYRV